MAISIELWTSERLVGGAEHWWDDVESALSTAHEDFPLLSRVDPYGDATFTRSELAPLADESRRLASTTTAPGVAAVAREIADLCTAGLEAAVAELRFVGD